PGDHGSVVVQRFAEDRDDEPQRQRDQRDGGDTLHPPVAGAITCRAAAQHLAQWRAQAHGPPAGGAMAVHPIQTSKAVSTSAATMTNHPLRRAWALSSPRPVSQTMWRIPLQK